MPAGGRVTAPVRGYCHRRFRPVEEAFRANFAEGLELGASVGMTWRGRMVVDLWGGWSDLARTKPWRRDTLVQMFSTTKVMVILCVLMLVERGKLDLDRPVYRYWPAFAQGGKSGVTVRDVLTHQGGVPGFRPRLSAADLGDWTKVTANIAAQPHWFGGEACLCYHPTTFGYILGEILRRVDGRGPARFFREEVARKARADFQIGIKSRADLKRIAELEFPEDIGIPPEIAAMMDAVALEVAGETTNMLANRGPANWEALSMEAPSGNGFGNGRSVARLCAIFAMGGKLSGRRYLSNALVAEAAREQVRGVDRYIGPIAYGLGFGLDNAAFPAPTPTCFHWGGIGGSWALMDPKAQASLGYAPNYLAMGPSSQDIRDARLSDALATLLPTLSR